MLIIHQNRAHERILFEKFLREITVKEGGSQQLLFPIELSFTPQERVILKEIQESLTKVGFVFESLEQETVRVTGVPPLMAEGEMISPQDLGALDDLPGQAQSSTGTDLKSIKRTTSIRSIQQAIQQCNGNKTEAAKLLGISRANLYQQLKSQNSQPSK